MKFKVLLNGFGRFGLHLLTYYLHNLEWSQFEIVEILDDSLSVEQMFKIIKSDRYCQLPTNTEIILNGKKLVIQKEGIRLEIKLTEKKNINLINLSQFDLIFECSGKFTDANKYRDLLRTSHTKVIISATSYNADQTLLIGFNHQDYSTKSQIVSYGSCTVNAFVPLTSALNSEFGVLNSDVNVIHNIPEYKLKSNPEILERRDCTLQKMAPKLLSFLHESNFHVNYTIVPFSGVSRIDFRYELDSKVKNLNQVFSVIDDCKNHLQRNLYDIDAVDSGPDNYLNKFTSASFIVNQSIVRGNNVYLSAYFDTENSVNRFFDLANYICEIGAKSV